MSENKPQPTPTPDPKQVKPMGTTKMRDTIGGVAKQPNPSGARQGKK